MLFESEFGFLDFLFALMSSVANAGFGEPGCGRIRLLRRSDIEFKLHTKAAGGEFGFHHPRIRHLKRFRVPVRVNGGCPD